MKTLKNYILLITALFIVSISYSQSDTTNTEPTFSISGSIDMYARTALGARNNYVNAYAPSSAFANLKGFSLGMANLIASYQGEKVGFTADLVFGPRGRDAVFYDAPFSGQRIINQMFAYIKLSKAVTLNIGQFNTFLGYEVISPTVNVNYSTSYLFSYGPFTHTGLRADFDFGGGFAGKLAIMNPTDMLEFNPVNTYTIGVQLGKSSDAGGIWLNFLYGDQDGKLEERGPFIDDDGLISSAGSLFQVDLTTGYNISDKFYLGFNASYQTVATGEEYVADEILPEPTFAIEDSEGDATSFMGVAIYPKITFSDNFLLGIRGEYFAVKKDHLDIFAKDAEGDGSVVAVTLSGNIKVGSLTLIPEIRIDKTSELSFADKDGAAKDMMTSLSLAAVYKF